MSNKKSFLLGVLTGVLSLAIMIGIVVVGKNFYENTIYNNEVAYDEGEDDEEIVESAGVFADNGNPVLTDAQEKYKIEVIPPTGFIIGEDYESAYETEFYNENQTLRLIYSIESYTADEMSSYYEFSKESFASAEDGQYSNVSTTEIKTIEANGYTVNYLSLSYTYNETENYTEYCAYVMIDEATEYMCNIDGVTGEVSEEIIKECFGAQLPVTK